MNASLQKAVLGLLLVAIIGVVGYIFWQMAIQSDNADAGEEGEIVCAKDARQCPDGSFVSRVPPTCQFAACPNSNAQEKSILLETRIGEGSSGLDVKIVPTALLEDSRCPEDVQCIQAGTVRVRALLTSGLGTGSQIFTLNQGITTEAEVVTLIGVRPANKKASQSIATSSYIFIFEVKKRTDI